MRLILCVLLLLISLELCAKKISVSNNKSQHHTNRTFRVDYQNNQFLKDGKKFQFVSGAFHYFRALPQKWRQIFRTIRAAGLNTVETYVQWTSHNPHDCQYIWTGRSNIERYLRLAVQEDLLVILRPSPFIDAEQSGGGFPYWLLTKYPNIKIRTRDPDYLKEVRKWYSKLMPRIVPYLYGNGGPIIMVQVENEYGQYGCDHEFMKWMRDETQKYVRDKAVLFTNSLIFDKSMRCSRVDKVFQTIDFSVGNESDINSHWQGLKKYQPNGPQFNAEFYSGFPTYWGEQDKHTTETKPIADTLRIMLKSGASANLYMFFGGTNFGFSSGADYSNENGYRPFVTSYDYDAPMNEAADVTSKYNAIRDVIKDFFPMPNIPVPDVAPKMELPSIKLSAKTTLFSSCSRSILGSPVKKSINPLTFEQINQGCGFVLYETMLPNSVKNSGSLKISILNDRATIYMNNTLAGTLTRPSNSIQIKTDYGRLLQILVECEGRISFRIFNESKGIIGDVTLNNQRLKNWKITGFPFENESQLTNLMAKLPCIKQASDVTDKIQNRNSDYLSNDPIIFEGKFDINENEIHDTYIDPTGWGKGFILVNGFNLGRYWPLVGPPITLYLPKEILLKRGNSMIVVELEKAPKNGEMKFSKTMYYRHNNDVPPKLQKQKSRNRKIQKKKCRRKNTAQKVPKKTPNFSINVKKTRVSRKS